MGVKRIVAVRHRKKKLLRFFLLVLLAAAVFVFVKQRKDFIVHEAKASLEAALSRESDFEVHIGKVSGALSGRVLFRDVSVLSPGSLRPEDRLVFGAKEISFRYRFLDFLSKKFASRIAITVQDPVVVCRPRVRLNHRHDFPFLGWMRQWALAQKDVIDVRVVNMSLLFKSRDFKLEGINLSYEDQVLKVEIPFRHLSVGAMDLSTVVKAAGDFHLGFFGREDSIVGEIHTEGTVINWSPLAEESDFHFSFSRSGFHLTSADLLGGIEVQGSIDFENDYRTQWDIEAKNYSLSTLSSILKNTPKSLLPSSVDLDIHFDGSPFAPHVEGHTRIYEGFIGKKTFKAMDLHVSGIYPSIKIDNSRLLLHDDSVMKLANKTVEFGDLFKEKTYETLVTEAQQDTVVWGDWEFRRPRDIKDNPEFLLQRTLGDRAHLNFREYKRDESMKMQPTDLDAVEVGLEYRLAGKNSLKLELREDEKFVGVERKMKF